MALNIKNKEVEDLARALAEDTDRSQVEVVLLALRRLRDELLADESHRIERRRQALMGWVEEMKRTPIPPETTREQAESELYDDAGLPK